MAKLFRRILELIFAVCLLVCAGMIVFTLPVSARAETVATSTMEYTITYHLDGGTNALKNPDVYTSEDVITLKDASKEGYTFKGWYLDQAKTQKITTISNRTGNLDIYAKFMPKSYTATFDGNGADEYGYKVTLKNDKTGEEKYVYLHNGDSFSPHEYWKPSASGYVYAGWTYNSEVLSDTLKINSDIELVPKWIANPNNYPVLDGGSVVIHTSETFYVSYDYEMCKYTCELYYYLEGGHLTANSIFEIRYGDRYGQKLASGDAYWDGIPYPGVNSTLRTGSFQVSPESPLYVDLSRSGKVSYLGGYIKITPSTKRTNIGRVEAINTIDFNESFNAPSAYKNDYTFLGWYDSNGNEITDTWQYLENQTFTAKWQPTKYNIAYNLDGGTNSLSNPSNYTIEDTITLSNPSKAGYTFKGWYSDANFTTQVTSISNKAENITLYAKFEVNSYNLTLDGDGGGIAPKITFISDGTKIKTCYLCDTSRITAYRPASKEGYIFVGWYLDEDCTQLFKFNGQIKDDTTLYAKWAKCDSNIINVESLDEFDVTIQGTTERLYAFVPLVDGQIKITSNSENLDLYGTLYDATKKALTSADDISDYDLDFSFSYNVKAGQVYYIAVKGTRVSVSGNATIDVEWTGACTIVGTTYPNRQVDVVYDTYYKLPEKPIREGYVFLGWFDEDDNQVVDGVWNFETDKTLTAKWEETTYHTVIFKDANGGIIFSETYYLSEDIVAPELPTKATDHIGSYYAKWDNNYTGVCTGDAVYTVVFEIEYIDYTVIFKDWNGNIISEQTYHYGDVVVEPDEPTRDADNTYTYTFNGWDSTVVACGGNATYTATYDQTYIDYIITFEHEDGSVISTDTYHYGDEVTIPSAPAKDSDSAYFYTFAGWDKEVADCVGDAVYVATYTANPRSFVIVFKDEATGETYKEAILTYGSVIMPPDVPTAQGKTFSKWNGYSEGMTVEGHVVFTIVWHIHNLVVENNVEPDCVNNGSYDNVIYCTECGEELSRETVTVDELGHTEVIDKAVEATCENTGLTEGKHCSVCETILVAQQEVEALGHKYESEITIEPTCTKPGVRIFTCQNDASHTYTEEVEAKGHSATEAVKENAVAPTCIVKGCYDLVVYCSVCNEELSRETVVVEALGHSYESAVTVPICTGQGYTTYTCSVCEHSYVDNYVDELGHNYKGVVTAPTCTEKGYTTYTCERCSDSYVSDYVDELGHSAGSIVLENNVEPDCTNKGSYDNVVYCTVCVDELSREKITVDALGHTEVIDEAVASTCTATGLTEGKHCSVCNEVLVAQEVVDELGHDYGDCIKNGNATHAKVCSNDNSHVITEECNYVNCSSNNDGTKTGTCVCGDTGVVVDETVLIVENDVVKGLTEYGKTLDNIVIPNSVTLIDDFAFWGCNSLTSIKIPYSVTIVDCSAFLNCESLKTVNYTGTIDQWVQISFYNVYANPLYYAEMLYINNELVAEGKITTATNINSYAFYGYITLRSIEIGDSVTIIGNGAFSSCGSLESIIVDEQNENYKSTDGSLYTKDGKTLIQYAIGKIETSFKIPVSVTSIANYAFYYCTSLESIIIPDSVTSIGYEAFRDCKSLTSVEIGDSVTSIGDAAFYRCSSLTNVVIPASVTIMGDDAFSGCNSLRNVNYTGTIDQWVQIQFVDISTNPLYYAKNLYINNQLVTEANITTATKIRPWAFYGYTSLTSVAIGDSVTTIGDYAFQSCYNLRDIELSNSVTRICSYAFRYCSSLTKVYYKGTTEEWDNISISTGNSYLTSSTRYYYIENESELPNDKGNYWHYDDNGEIERWEEHVHAYSVVVVEPTCTEPGYATYTCYCGNSYVDNYLASHRAGNIVVENNVEPNCTNKGSYDNVIYCTVCEDELSREKITVDELGHTEVIDKAVVSTCTATGLTEGKHCSVCNEVLIAQQVVDELGHDYKGVVTAPTCTEQGYTTYTCTRCGDSYVDDYVDELGHTEVTDEAVASTCTETGLTEGKHCSVCNEVLVAQEVVSANGHSYGEWYEIQAPTETQVGEKRRDCENQSCQVYETSPIAMLNHSHDRYESITLVATEPTCTETGLTEGKKCGGCGEVLVAQETIPAKGHKEIIDEAVVSTCTKTGLTEGKHCSVCNEVLVEQEVIDELGHTEGAAIVENRVEPTCMIDGSYDSVISCSVCDTELSRVSKTIEKLGHEYEAEWTIDAESTCVTDGSKSHHCVRCEEKADITAIPANGHSYGEWYEIQAPTCTVTGTDEHKCSDCQATETRTIAALGHTEAEAVVENRVEPTCTENGNYDSVIYCSVCNDELSRETKIIDKLGHDYSTERKYDETNHWNECACGWKNSIEPHSWNDGVITKEATVDEEGIKTYECSVCGATKEEIVARLVKEGLSGGAIAGIAVGSTAVVGTGGFSLFWVVIKKKKWADLIAIFKK